MSSSGQHSQLPPSTTTADLTAQQTPHAPSHAEASAQIGSSNYAPNDSQLAGLVKAATAAAGQQDVSEWGAAAAAAVAVAAGAAGHTHHFDSYGTHMQMEEDTFGNANFETGVAGGRQTSTAGMSHETMQSSGLSRAVSRKRRRGEDPLDPALTSSMGFGGGDRQDQAHQQQSHHEFKEHGLGIRSLPSQQSSPDPRAAEAHSAAALFRQPSSNKKYTRPPVSRLFTSLELSPENFLHLQAAAKAFMLDDKYPKRRDCVGQRGKGDTEMVKLRLWNCVRQFLEAEGNGERFFSEHVVNEGMGPRTYVWPRDQHKIISLVIPLLRRMVTNERQRQYAIETRKPGGVEDRRRRRTEDGQVASNASSPRQHYMSEEPLHLSTPQQPEQHTQHAQLLDHFNPAPAAIRPPPPPPPPPPPQPQVPPTQQAINPGLADLFEGGPPTDLDMVAQSYDFYNRDSQLDNLWAVSGLPQPDWRGLVGAADSHYQVTHQGQPECPGPCEEQFLEQIFSSPSGAKLNWRVGGRGSHGTRNEFATGITRDILRIVRDNLAARRESTAQAPDPPSGADQQSTTAQQSGYLRPDNVPSQSATASGISTSSTPHHSNISLRINILENGKRIVPRLDVLASQCPDLESLRQTILRRYTGQLPTTSSSAANVAADASTTTNGVLTSSEPMPSRWKIKVWLPSGVVPVVDDGEWSLALLSLTNFDWMDGDLRVLVDVGGNAGNNNL